ncbi:peptidoglycan-associated lipoprotein Pal [Moraxella sp. Tifton1]|uniref:peptidoglycan-associated lipoprotein Pal n=1 Tax=Moraxella oculi TaxID=2940516 RepID=UPI002011DE1E|nr:peptidoglycan-associated lipoprotein Pal [Moraxella sp. Tifton1]MCL1623009.1 peptidoglycan-associated lipoprotein Pal [Moraxella sp. Tifton1]
MLANAKHSLLAIGIILSMAGCVNTQTTQRVLVAPIGFTAHTKHTHHNTVPSISHGKTAITQTQGVVYFDFDSDRITEQAAQILDAQVKFLKTNSIARSIIAGHADERGSREYNISLGKRRAIAVYDYLAKQGVDTANIEIISFGEERPAVLKTGEVNWAKNRRVELIHVYDGKNSTQLSN